MRKTFDAELLELNEELTAMARQAQDAIDVVTRACPPTTSIRPRRPST
jgi:phosphate transport system protein